ncbi:hypothetical protein D6779_04380 [Candidatus Parcubacteria bacterium]|nr:MAG: hypothetical protein D6779_04380 [Candidatus Parcubacteria bacterium]
MVSFLQNVRFVFMWGLAHAIAGAIGLTLEHFWACTFLGTFFSVVFFEVVLGMLKHRSLRFNEPMKAAIFVTDMLAWVLGGLLILMQTGLAYLFKDPLEMGAVPMLILLIWSGIGAATFSTMFVLFGQISWPAVRLRVRKVKQYLAEHLLLTLLCLPCFFLVAILCFGVIGTAFLLYGVSVTAVFFAPLEHFQATFRDFSPVYLAKALLGASSAGWIGLLTGVVYTYILPVLKKINQRLLSVWL